MMPSTAKKLLHETVQFLVGFVALASLTWLCARLGFRPVSAALVFLILIVLLSLAGSFFGALALSFLALGSFAYFFSPRLVHLDYLEDVVAVILRISLRGILNIVLRRGRRSPSRPWEASGPCPSNDRWTVTHGLSGIRGLRTASRTT